MRKIPILREELSGLALADKRTQFYNSKSKHTPEYRAEEMRMLEEFEQEDEASKER